MLISLLGISIILLDQITKYYVVTHMHLGQSRAVIDNIFHFTYVLNPGAAFGILQNQTLFFVVVAVVLISAATYFFPKIPAEQSLLRLGLGLQVGGAIGNLIDRLRTGSVIDFLDFRIWPVFNVADIAIVTGVGLIIISLFTESRRQGQQYE